MTSGQESFRVGFVPGRSGQYHVVAVVSQLFSVQRLGTDASEIRHDPRFPAPTIATRSSDRGATGDRGSAATTSAARSSTVASVAALDRG